MFWCTVNIFIICFAKWTEGGYFKEYFTTQESLVEELTEDGRIKSEEVKSTILQVDRSAYLNWGMYEEIPNIEPNPPYTCPLALELFKDHLMKPGCKALDVACGSGYLAACMAIMITAQKGVRVVGKKETKDYPVIGLLRTDKEIEMAKLNIEQNNKDLLQKELVTFIRGVFERGAPMEGPFDVIHISEGVKELPKAYLNQLNNGGRLIVPINATIPDKGGDGFRVFVYDKHSNGTVTNAEITFLPVEKYY